MRTRIKICGITRAEDALVAARLGADAIGFVFYEPSARHLTSAQAHKIARQLPPFVTKVGLFVNATAEQVDAAIKDAALDLLQFHGDEDAVFCGSFTRPYIKAIRMQQGVDLHAIEKSYQDAAGLLLDSHVEHRAGGTGQTFDWSRVPHDLRQPLILAGGLSVANVANAIKAVQPYAVDVSSGVERSQGIKDADSMAAFINEVNKIT